MNIKLSYKQGFFKAGMISNYTGSMNLDAPGPTVHGDIAPFRVWQALHTSDWDEISGALTDK